MEMERVGGSVVVRTIEIERGGMITRHQGLAA